MHKFSEKLKANLLESIQAKQALLEQPGTFEVFEQAVACIVHSYRQGGRLYIAGNGGSAADAQHLAAEFVAKFSRPRAPLAAEALTTDTSTLTAIGNDFGFEEVFSRQIIAKASPDDVFLAISTSGNSKNILRALEECKKKAIPSILFSGGTGGEAAKLAQFNVLAPTVITSHIQEIHQVLYHTLCECVETELLFN